MDVEKKLRILAKSNYYQTIFSQEKSIGLNLFRNKTDFTHIQITFLGYLSFYNALYFDIAIGEVDEKVFENNIYEDAYMHFRRHSKRKEEGLPKKNMEKSKPVTSQWVFKSKKSPKKA